jgi:hypothetical protein
MHSLDAVVDVGCEVPDGTYICDRVTGRKRCRAAVVDIHPVRCSGGRLAPVEGDATSGDE